MTSILRIAFVLFLLASPLRAAELSLAGPWSVLLDRQNNAESHQWHTPAFWNSGKDAATVMLPGSLQAQHLGDLPDVNSPWTARIGMNLLKNPKYAPYQKAGDFKTPFWLTPDRVYVGSAWYQREIDIPPTFNGRRITLTLERAHWETTVWIDGKQAGPPQNSLATAHVYDLTDALGPTPAGTHTLAIRVDNRIKIPVGLDASSVTDQTQTNWNGIVGDLKLEASPSTWIDDIQAYPDLANKKVKLRLTVRHTGQPLRIDGGIGITAVLRRGKETSPLPSAIQAPQWQTTGNTMMTDLFYDLGPDAQPWNEFSPALYDLTVALRDANSLPIHQHTISFGLRELSTRGTQFLLNNHPLFLRGTLECAIFPLTGYPPTGEVGRPYWTKIFSQARAFGLNHLRFHSWCPPEIAFQVADEMGFYLQVEGPVWAAFGSSGRPPAETQAEDAGGIGGASLDQWIVKEADAILKAYGNHPSFLLMAAANEPGSRTNQPNANFLNTLVDQWKAKDPRHLYTGGSNWPNVPNANYQVMSQPRLQAGNTLNRLSGTDLNYASIVSQWQVPIISHESGQWCAYPNFEEIPKYTGALKPGNLEIFQDFLAKSGMADQAKDFLIASGKFQALLYKEEIEAFLRTPGLGGFQLLDLHDFPGQGTAPVGVLDAFWDPKPYITAEQYHRFCGPTVPLATMPRRIYTAGETLSADLFVSHFGNAPLPSSQQVAFGTKTSWRLLDASGTVLKAGTLPTPEIPPGALTKIGSISIPLKDLPAPAQVKLEIALGNPIAVAFMPDGHVQALGNLFINDWDLWVYPPAAETSIVPSGQVRIAHAFDDDTKKFLDSGGRVLLLPPLDRIAGNTRSSFSPIFWNRITFTNPSKEHTLSIMCDPTNKAFAAFPTDFHTNWQWRDLLQQQHSKPMTLDALPRTIKPLIQFIDDWDTARRLALAIETNVGENGGKLLICSIDLETDIGPPTDAPPGSPSPRPVARQLLSSLLKYMASDRFLAVPEPAFTPDGELIPQPPVPLLTIDEIQSLFK